MIESCAPLQRPELDHEAGLFLSAELRVFENLNLDTSAGGALEHFLEDFETDLIRVLDAAVVRDFQDDRVVAVGATGAVDNDERGSERQPPRRPPPAAGGPSCLTRW